MFRNWPEICKIECRLTRIAIAACEEPGTLQKLQERFPECFSEKRGFEKIPRSVLEHSYRNYRGPVLWEWAMLPVCKEFGIPILERWGGGERAGNVVRNQLIGQDVKLFMPVTHERVSCLAIAVGDKRTKRIDERSIERGLGLTLIPAENVAMDR